MTLTVSKTHLSLHAMKGVVRIYVGDTSAFVIGHPILTGQRFVGKTKEFGSIILDRLLDQDFKGEGNLTWIGFNYDASTAGKSIGEWQVSWFPIEGDQRQHLANKATRCFGTRREGYIRSSEAGACGKSQRADNTGRRVWTGIWNKPRPQSNWMDMIGLWSWMWSQRLWGILRNCLKGNNLLHDIKHSSIPSHSVTWHMGSPQRWQCPLSSVNAETHDIFDNLMELTNGGLGPKFSEEIGGNRPWSFGADGPIGAFWEALVC